MKITLKLFATLSDYLPDVAKKSNQAELEVADNATIDAVIDQYRLPRPLVHLVLLNGVFVSHEERVTKTFREGDVLAIWPPIAGG